MEKIVVIKLGSSILMTQRGKLDEFRIAHIADQVAALKKQSFGVILVVSGAVACGHKVFACLENSQTWQRAAAGIGQALVTTQFTTIFNQKKLQVAQILLTKDNFLSTAKRKQIKEILELYLHCDCVALINENDVIDLHSFGGNDFLAGEVASLVGAQQLIILSTYDKSRFGVGGGKTKQEAIALMKTQNIQADILDGKAHNSILRNIL